MALSADANTALLGAFNHALVFTRASSGWQQHPHPLTASPYEHNAISGARNTFNAVAALSGDGTRAVIGGPVAQGCGKYFDEACTGKAVAWAFSRVGEAWVRQPLPLVHELPFGAYVAVSGNGEVALIQGVTPGSEPGGAVFASQLTPAPQAGFVIEPTWIDYEGAIELQLWTPIPASFTATARVIPASSGRSPRGSRCGHIRPMSRLRPTRRCSVAGSPLYGTGTAKGAENVGLGIVPRPAMRRYLATHKRVKLRITIRSKPAASGSAVTQTATVVVPFRKPPPPAY